MRRHLAAVGSQVATAVALSGLLALAGCPGQRRPPPRPPAPAPVPAPQDPTGPAGPADAGPAALPAELVALRTRWEQVRAAPSLAARDALLATIDATQTRGFALQETITDDAELDALLVVLEQLGELRDRAVRLNVGEQE